MSAGFAVLNPGSMQVAPSPRPCALRRWCWSGQRHREPELPTL